MFSKTDYKRRIENARAALGKLDAILINKDENLRYFTGVDSGRLLIWKDGAKFWLNEVYLDRAKNSYLKPAVPKKEEISKFIFKTGFKRVGTDPVTLHDWHAMKPKLRKIIKPTDICENIRKIKEENEIKLLSRAGKIASNAMRVAMESKLIGMTEFEVSAMVEYEIRKNGSERAPFNQGILCLSGPNTRFPHAPTSARKLRGRDLLILDIGAVYQGYFSDMTRTLEIGKVSEDRHNLVGFMDLLKEEAIDRVELGGKISEIHEYIEKEIETKGYKFAHLAGHGVGLEIHEKPSIGPSEEDVFQDGMVFTIEPGIYHKHYGARSEDTIALTDNKKRILTA